MVSVFSDKRRTLLWRRGIFRPPRANYRWMQLQKYVAINLI